MALRTTRRITSLTAAVGLLFGCAGETDPIVNGVGSVFESDNPENTSQDKFGGAETADNSPSTDGNDSSHDAASRAIEEADIIKIEGNRLYALSPYGGLNIIDLSERDHLRLLGRKKVQATPFEMYVRDSIVFALYNGYGEYIEAPEDGYWNWIQTSYVMAFDTKDPKNPTVVGKFPVSGSISDSRLVGDILYVVGFENNGCWDCDAGQHTTVLSLTVASPANIEKVAQLSFTEDTSKAWSWTRSISVNDQRMYVAGPQYGMNGPVGSTIQVIDISDPGGALVEGATVPVTGTVNSRWQMDEYQGYLRVISQPNAWSMTEPVSVQTFKVESAQRVTKAATASFDIPNWETLRSVRFDGPRGYAITAEQTDPLFTVDLSVPTAPRQAGSLVMPGWVYYMEPRGDRVVALGFDQGNEAGALTVSLFDVFDLDNPTMLDRVNFGGNWAWVSEGQDQIHKAFQVLDDAQLVLMPFSGWEYSADRCSGRSVNGIQLIDWYGDDLTLRGVASLVGQPRRGFLHNDRLFAVSEERVESYDITDRNTPKRTDSLKTAENVSTTVVAGKTVVKLTTDWYSNSVGLDTTTLANVESPEALGHLDLPIGNNTCSYAYLGNVTATADRVYLLVHGYDNGTSEKASWNTRLLTVDVSLPNSPKLLGQANLDFGEGFRYWYGGNLVSAGQNAVAVGNAVVVLSNEYRYDANYNYLGTQSVAHVVDVTEPSNPSVTAIDIPSENGTTGLFVSGSTVALGYYLASPVAPDRVRFYASRFDVSNPAKPERLPPVNVPGSLLAFDTESSNAITADYQEVSVPKVSREDCYGKYGSWSFESPDNSGVGTCYTLRHTLYLTKLGEQYATVLGSQSLDLGQRIDQVAQGQDRLFFTIGNNYGYAVMADAAWGGGYGYGFKQGELPLFVVSGLSSGAFQMGSLPLTSGTSWYGSNPLVAWNERALLSTGFQGKLVVVDGSVPADPIVVREVDIPGYVSNLTVTAGVGIAAMGYDGVATVQIE